MVPDFVEVYDSALDASICRSLIDRFGASRQARRGETGEGVDLLLKNSWDIPLHLHRAGRTRSRCSTMPFSWDSSATYAVTRTRRCGCRSRTNEVARPGPWMRRESHLSTSLLPS